MKNSNCYCLKIFRALHVSWKGRSNNKGCTTNIETFSASNSCVIILIINGGSNQNYTSATNTSRQIALRQKERKYHTGSETHPEKPWTQNHRQTLAEQLLGQVWRNSSQTLHRNSLQRLSPLRSGLQPIQ